MTLRRRSLLLAAPALLLPRPVRAWQKRRAASVFEGRYFEMTTTHWYVSGFNPATIGFGVADETASLDNAGFWNSAAEQVAMSGIVGMSVQAEDGGVSGIGYPQPRIAVPDADPDAVTYACAVNLTDKLQWLRNVTAASDWWGFANGEAGDPSTNFKGWDISAKFTGNVHVFCGCTQRNNTNYGEGVVNLGGSAFAGAVPSGYVAWGVADTLNPADKYTGITLSGGNLTFSTAGAGDLNSQGRIVRSVGSFAF